MVYLIVIGFAMGCTSNKPYRYGRKNESNAPYHTAIESIRDGRNDHPKLDRIEENLYAPIDGLRARLSRSNWTKQDLPKQREQAASQAIAYLSQNDLADVHVAWREYDPADQWRRLRNNEDIHPIWKYTDGSIRVIASSILPERVFRSDRYNPHTKTLHLNSADASRAVYAAATAKDFLGHPWPGLYAASRYIPIVPAYQHSRIAQDAISYAQSQDDWELERRMYPTAYSRVGGSLLSEVYGVAPGTSGMPFFVGPVMSLTGRLVGRGVGRWHASNRQEQIQAIETSSKPDHTATLDSTTNLPVNSP